MNEIIFSGVKPSGELQLGNYLGAIRNWVNLQNENKGINYFSIVDLHAITVPQDTEDLRRRTLTVAKLFLAAGIDPEKSNIFIQSHVSEHSELAWLLNCYTYMGELNKMTQFKEKAKTKAKDNDVLFNVRTDEYRKKIIEELQKENWQEKAFKTGIDIIDDITFPKSKGLSVGLFDYPVLMAADVLLYGTTKIPVGEDQIQHVELARDIAKRINNKYEEEIFTIPNYAVNKVGARIMGLQNPEKKMSKSDSGEKNLIYLLDDPEIARKKIMSAVTDDKAQVKYDPESQPGVSNLLEIYSLLANKKIEESEAELKDLQYGEFKKIVADEVAKFLEDLQAKYNAISDEEILEILKIGAETASKVAKVKLDKIKNLIGFISK